MKSLLVIKKNDGQSLIEILIAVAIGTIMITAAAAVIVPALRINTQTDKAQVGTALAKELLENVRVWAEADWNNVLNLTTTSHYYLKATSSPFSVFSGDESISVTTTTYTRYFYVENVNRDGSDLVVSSGGSNDPSTKKVTIMYSWPHSATSSISAYITRNRNTYFLQTDWSGGPGLAGPTTSTSRFSTSTNIDYAGFGGSISILPSAPFINITVPLGGEHWQWGSTHTLRWAIGGLLNPLHYLDMEIYNANDSSTGMYVYTQIAASPGQFDLTLPPPGTFPSSTYIMHMWDRFYTPNPNGWSGVFTITE